MRSRGQAQRSEGLLGLALRRTGGGTYWTMTLWRDSAAMRAFMLSGAHRDAMPKLAGWCDEAAVAHWEITDNVLPGWAEGEDRLAREGRLTPVTNPSPAHAAGKTLGSSHK